MRYKVCFFDPQDIDGKGGLQNKIVQTLQRKDIEHEVDRTMILFDERNYNAVLTAIQYRIGGRDFGEYNVTEATLWNEKPRWKIKLGVRLIGWVVIAPAEQNTAIWKSL